MLMPLQTVGHLPFFEIIYICNECFIYTQKEKYV
jgi:hypothetical protein